jgi:hypothetical protein
MIEGTLYTCKHPEDGRKVTVRVLYRWSGKGPRNVLVVAEGYVDGYPENMKTKWVRPFRGMRRVKG